MYKGINRSTNERQASGDKTGSVCLVHLSADFLSCRNMEMWEWRLTVSKSPNFCNFSVNLKLFQNRKSIKRSNNFNNQKEGRN